MTAARVYVVAALVLAAFACSDAPKVPVQETGRNVLAEINFRDTI